MTAVLRETAGDTDSFRAIEELAYLVVAALKSMDDRRLGLRAKSLRELFTCTSEAAADLRPVDWRLAVKKTALRHAAQLAKLGAWEVDMASGQVYYSDELCEILGWPLGSRPTLADALATCRPGNRAQLEKAFHDVSAEAGSFQMEVEITRPSDGAMIWLAISAEAEMQGSKCISIRGAAQDVTLQNRNRAELDKVRRQLAATLFDLEQAEQRAAPPLFVD